MRPLVHAPTPPKSGRTSPGRCTTGRGPSGPDPEDMVQWEGSLATPAEVTAYLELLSAALDELRAEGRDY